MGRASQITTLTTGFMFVVYNEFWKRIEWMTVADEELSIVGFLNVIMLHYTIARRPATHE